MHRIFCLLYLLLGWATGLWAQPGDLEPGRRPPLEIGTRIQAYDLTGQRSLWNWQFYAQLPLNAHVAVYGGPELLLHQASEEEFTARTLALTGGRAGVRIYPFSGPLRYCMGMHFHFAQFAQTQRGSSGQIIFVPHTTWSLSNGLQWDAGRNFFVLGDLELGRGRWGDREEGHWSLGAGLGCGFRIW